MNEKRNACSSSSSSSSSQDKSRSRHHQMVVAIQGRTTSKQEQSSFYNSKPMTRKGAQEMQAYSNFVRAVLCVAGHNNIDASRCLLLRRQLFSKSIKL
jgi:hypothetical protein